MTNFSDDHLDPLTLARRLRNGETWQGRDLQNFVAHLAAGCSVCSKSLLQITQDLDEFPDDEADPPQAELTHHFESALQSSGVLDRTREAALAHRHTSRSSSSDERGLDLPGRDEEPSLRSPEMLLEWAKATWTESTKLARSLVLLALDLCGQMTAEPFQGALEDLRARGCAYLMNCLRLMDDFPAAEIALEQALTHVRLGSGDPLVRADVLSLAFSLRRDQRRLGEAAEFLGEAAAIYQQSGELHRAGRAVLLQSVLAEAQGRFELALELLEKARGWIDFEQEPALEGNILHNTIGLLADGPRAAEAHRLLVENRSVYDQPGNESIRFRLPWLEGKIALALGALDEAEEKLRQAQLLFLDHETPLTWAMASLDLAIVLARQERWTELETLAHSLLETFQHFELPQEGFAALKLLTQAAEGQFLTVQILRETALILSRLPPLKARPTS